MSRSDLVLKGRVRLQHSRVQVFLEIDSTQGPYTKGKVRFWHKEWNSILESPWKHWMNFLLGSYARRIQGQYVFLFVHTFGSLELSPLYIEEKIQRRGRTRLGYAQAAARPKAKNIYIGPRSACHRLGQGHKRLIGRLTRIRMKHVKCRDLEAG